MKPLLINRPLIKVVGIVPIHEPRRGDDVDAWIKRNRDYFSKEDFGYVVLDTLLNDYREHADTGTPLHLEIERGKM